MQLSTHKIDKTLVSSFVARTTRFNSCVYFYCYDPPIAPQRRGQKYQERNKHNLPIDLPIDTPTGRDTREPQIDRSSNLPIKLPIAQKIPKTKDYLEDETKMILTEPKLSTSRSPNRTTICSHDLLSEITREIQISRLSPRSPNRSPDQ